MATKLRRFFWDAAPLAHARDDRGMRSPTSFEEYAADGVLALGGAAAILLQLRRQPGLAGAGAVAAGGRGCQPGACGRPIAGPSRAIGWMPWPASRSETTRVVTSGLLPATVREAYGLPWYRAGWGGDRVRAAAETRDAPTAA